MKCCLNYEVDDYMEAGRKLPSREVVLQTLDSDYFLFKSDILAGMVTYSTDKRVAANLETITGERAKEVIEMNRRGEKPASLQPDGKQQEPKGPVDLLAGDSITRFDKAKKKKKKKPQNRQGGGQQQQPAQHQPKAAQKPAKKNKENKEHEPKE